MNMQIVPPFSCFSSVRPGLRDLLAACTALLLANTSPTARAELSAASGAVAISGGTGTRQITSPGTYFLSGDLVSGVSADGIQILASKSLWT